MIVPISQNKISCLSLTSALIAIGLWALRGADLNITLIWHSATGAVTITALLSILFDRWGWRYLPESVTGVPNLYGTWKGTAKYKWNEFEQPTKEGKIDPFYISLDQYFSKITITTHTEQSSSTSLPCSFHKDAGGSWICLYAYENSPKMEHLSESRPHRGAGQINANLVGDSYDLNLEYWTDRWTQGVVKFKGHKAKVSSSYAAAQHLFGDTKNAN